jgi:hypothetical protein
MIGPTCCSSWNDVKYRCPVYQMAALVTTSKDRIMPGRPYGLVFTDDELANA